MKKTNTKTKRNLKNKKRKTKKVRKNMKRGGEYIDSGTYGAVYANPRMLCEGEELDTPGIYDEVSKIFQDDESAEKENNNVEKLKTFLQERGILEEFKEYAIIPERICNLNRASLIEPPYNTDEWKKNKKNKYYSILNPDTPDVPTTIKIINDQNQIVDIPVYNKIIISEKGGNDLHKIIRQIITYDQFKDFLQKLTSIGEGIQLLQNNGLIHGDIKDKNCLEHNGRFKIIDLSDIREISTTNDPEQMPYSFGYYIWPITAFYTYLFDKEINFNNINDMNQIINFNNIIENFFEGNYNNFNTDYIKYSKALFNNAFKTSNLGYTQQQLEEIKQMKDNLINQKTGFVEKNYNNLRIDTIPTFNEMFTTTFKDIDEFKMDLFKRIDIYSFGIMILESINKYLKYTQPMTDNRRETIMNLYVIAYKCCYQEERVADINIIIELYKDTVNSM
jgi:serine/threonine protein kinase